MTHFTDFLSINAFREPEWRPTSAWLEHGPFAFWLVEELRPKLVVELGTHNGYSFAVFCEAMKIEDINGRVVAVDTWQGDVHAGCYDDFVYHRLKDHIDRCYGDFAEMKRMLFVNALADIKDRSIDLLHIDGRHFYDDVKEDHLSWVPKLADGAVVLFHDTQVQERDFGVFRYWAELKAMHALNFEFLHGHGLGILSHGPTRSDKVNSLLSADLPETVRDEVKLAYARLGSSIKSNVVDNSEPIARKKSPIQRLVKNARKRLAMS